MTNSRVIIYTDGACKGNPGVGGWGALICYKDKKKSIFGGEQNVTNNQMELKATIEAISVLKKPCDIDLWTDSTYVKKGITEWIHTWKKNNWKNAAKKTIANKELWVRLDQVTKNHNIQWHWVKGHSGNAGNEVADSLANQGVDKALKGL